MLISPPDTEADGLELGLGLGLGGQDRAGGQGQDYQGNGQDFEHFHQKATP
ncbi:MAG: hypothetical protein WBQ36_01245 [Desulfobaccales bacterium]